MQKHENNEAQPKFTGSYKKKLKKFEINKEKRIEANGLDTYTYNSRRYLCCNL